MDLTSLSPACCGEPHLQLLSRVACKALLILMCLGVYATAGADNFSFSARAQQEQAEAQEEEARKAQAIQTLVAVPCQRRLKNAKILLLVAEHTEEGRWIAYQERYQSLLDVIETRLRALGMKTYTAQQIKASIAQGELDAYFKNDPDAALSASRRLGANYILRGNLTRTNSFNRISRTPEVSIDMDLTLTGVDGHILSDVSTHAESYSGNDTLHTALSMVREQADPLLAQLYNDYCRTGLNH